MAECPSWHCRSIRVLESCLLKKLDPEGLAFAAVVDVALRLRSSSVLLINPIVSLLVVISK